MGTLVWDSLLGATADFHTSGVDTSHVICEIQMLSITTKKSDVLSDSHLPTFALPVFQLGVHRCAIELSMVFRWDVTHMDMKLRHFKPVCSSTTFSSSLRVLWCTGVWSFCYTILLCSRSRGECPLILKSVCCLGQSCSLNISANIRWQSIHIDSSAAHKKPIIAPDYSDCRGYCVRWHRCDISDSDRTTLSDLPVVGWKVSP